MKKYIRNIILFFAIMAVVDIAFGNTCKYLIAHAKGGDAKSHNYVAKECNEDILIFGSSRALHHYVPSIINDSLGMSCYNCGWDGNGIIYQYGRLQMILQRYTPKAIIYDVFAGFDMVEDDHTKYLDLLKRYYDIPGISDIFGEIAPMEKYKLLSNLYKYNSSFSSMAMDFIKPRAIVLDGGYKPNYGMLQYDPTDNGEVEKPAEWDELKKDYMMRFIKLCEDKGIKLIFMYSPMYFAKSSVVYDNMSDICHEQNIPLLDYYADKRFQDRKYHYDAGHLNDEGARFFTMEIIKDLRPLVEE